MIKPCDPPVDVQDVQFRLHCRLKVFENSQLEAFPNANHLVSVSSRFGLAFIGTTSNEIQVIKLSTLQDCSPKDKDITTYQRRTVNLPAPAKHLITNCDGTILAVVSQRNNFAVASFYEVASFLRKEVALVCETQLSGVPGCGVSDIGWNPTLPAFFTVCLADGSLAIYELGNGNFVDKKELPAASGAVCFCWSPRGKQIAVGSKDGKITQYKPTLQAVKVVPPPDLGKPLQLIALQWVSTFQFIGTYWADNIACIIVVDAPKAGPVSYTNYEDICFSGTTRQAQYYLIGVQEWGLLMVASANSSEVCVLGQNSPEKWVQWTIADSVRPELPLSTTFQDTFPVGMALDLSQSKPLPWGESTIPPAPVLLLLSHHGLLCLFHVINLKPGLPTICSPPPPLDDLTEGQFVAPISVQSIIPPQNTMPVQNTLAPQSNTPLQSTSNFGIKLDTPPVQTLFQGQTVLTPISKPTAAPPPTPSTPTTQAKYSSIFSALNQETPKQAEVIVKTIEKAPEPQIEPPPEPDDSAQNELLGHMLQADCTSLESELYSLLNLGRSLNVNVGTKEEKTELSSNLNSLESFLKEITDISTVQNGEIHSLKQNLIQSWAWYEEARSIYNTANDETMIILLRAQPLDSASEKHLQNIQNSMYNLESQLSQASKALDEQWYNFQSFTRKSLRNQLPTMETIFQTMVRQNTILQKSAYILADLCSRISHKSRNSGLLMLGGTKKLDLEDQMKNLTLGRQDIYVMQYDRIEKTTQQIKPEKVVKLRGLLKAREVPHVSVIKPNLSTSILQSPISRGKHLISILGAQMSPVPKSSVVKTLDFVQSTPKREIPTTSFIPVQPVVPQVPAPAPIKTTPLIVASTSSETLTSAVTPEVKPLSFNFTGTKSLEPKSTSIFTATTPKTPTTTLSFSFSAKPATTNLFSAPASTTSTKSTFSFAAKPAFSVTVTTQLPEGKAATFGTSEAPEKTSSVAPAFGKTIINVPKVVPASSTTSFFAQPPSTTVHLFAGSTTTLPTTGIFATSATTSSTFTVSLASSTTTSSSGLFSGTANSLFGKTTSSSTITPASQASLFATSTTSETKPNLFVVSTASKPLFNTTKLTSTTTSSSTEASKSVFVGAVSAASTTSSLFGTKPSLFTTSFAPTGVSIFAVSSATPASTCTSSITTSSSLFGASSVASTTPSSFGASIVASTTTSSIFGGASTTVVSSTTTATSTVTFGTSSVATTSSTVAPSTTAIFLGTTTSSNVQVASVAPATTITSTPSIFGGTTVAPASPTVTFGASTVTSTPSIFGATTGASTTSSATPVASFGASTGTTTPSIFGGTTSTPSSFVVASAAPTSSFGATTNSTSIFGAAVSSAPIFGASTTATTTSSPFGAPAATIASPFGATPPSSTTTTPFGAVAPTSTSSSIFGEASSTPSIFGAAAASLVSSSSLFGGTATPSSTSSIFGGAPASSPSIFGGSAPFGSAAATTTASSIFGGSATFGQTSAAPSFGSTSIFGTSTSTPATSPFGGTPSSGVFGATTQAQPQQSFGFGNLSVNQSASGGSLFGSSSFGQASPAAANPFQKATTAQSSVFGTPASTSASLFGSNNSNTSFTSFGGGNSNSVFGGSATFGQQPQQPAFGQSTFGQSSFGSPQPAGPFSGGGGVAQSGFGSPGLFQQKPAGGFGAAPVFGSTSPGFGASPSFGGAATFGAAPAFGSSPNKMFGASSPTASFATGATQQQSPSFGNLANQNTVGFGSLAQQSPSNPPAAAPFSGNSSFSSWR